MGTVVRAKGVDGSKWASELILPGTLGDGLRGAFLFREQMENSLINMAPDGVQGARVVGTPTISADFKYGIFKSASAFVQTELAEFASHTIVSLSRAPNAKPPTQPSADAPFIFGNYSGVISPAASGTTMWHPQDNGASITTTRLDTGVNQNRGVTITAPAGTTYKTWHALCGDVGPNTSSMEDFTTGVKGTSVSIPRGDLNSNKMRIGSSYVSNQNGDAHIAAVLYWDRVLTTTEKAAIKTWILAYQALMGITD